MPSGGTEYAGSRAAGTAIGLLVTILAAVVLLAALPIVMPAPTRRLLPLSVAAPELSPWILLAALIIAPLAMVAGPGPRARSAAGACAILAAALSLVPLTGIPGAVRDVNDRLHAGLGADYMTRLPGDVRSALRPDAVRVRELLLGLRQAAPRITRGVPFASPAGSTLTLDIYQPSASGRPVVVQIYGGAWQRGEPGDDPAMASALAQAGFLVFAIDYRHAPRWQWPAQLEDVREGLAWVRAHSADYGGDASRIALIGRSSGAHLALMLAFAGGGNGTSPVRGVVSLYGPADLTAGYRELPRPDPIDVRATLQALMGGTPDTMPDRYRAGSPATYASSPQPPTLQIIGSHDHVVLPRFARRLDTQLVEAGNVSILMELPWSEHAFDAVPFGPGAQIALYATERFLASVLGPAP